MVKDKFLKTSIFLFLLITGTLHGNPNLIVMGGVNFSNQQLEYLKATDIYNESFAYKKGTSLGIYLEYGTSRFIKMSLGSRYSDAGMKRTLYTTGNAEVGSQRIVTSNSLNCLEFPILIKLNLLKTRFKPYISTGLYYRFILDFNQYVDIEITEDKSENYEWEFSKMKNSLGWEVILGCSIDFTNYSLIFQYSNKSDISYPYNVDGLRMKSFSHDISMGISVPLKK